MEVSMNTNALLLTAIQVPEFHYFIILLIRGYRVKKNGKNR